MDLEMMYVSLKRHTKLLSLIFTLSCLSKTSVIRMFVYFNFQIKNKQENIPPYPFPINFKLLIPCFCHMKGILQH